MTLRITCPGCKTALKFGDDMRGRKVRCSNCDKGLSIPSANGKVNKAEEEEDEEQEQEEERPAKKKKKKKKKQGAPVALYGGIGVGVLLFLIVAGVAVAFLVKHGDDNKPVVVAKNPDPEEKDNRTPQRIVSPDIREGNPANQKVGGKSITGNMRGQIYRTERRAELRQIGLLYSAYCDETPRSSRTEEDFLKSMQRDNGKVVQVIREGYYVLNMKADHKSSSSIVAYERDIDTSGYLCARPTGEVDHVPLEEWKKLLGK